MTRNSWPARCALRSPLAASPGWPAGYRGGGSHVPRHPRWPSDNVSAFRGSQMPVTLRINSMDTTLARPPVGQLLDGRYRVESHIARGGMATVYLGTDTRLDRTVALKIMHAELANDEDFVRRFVGEARSVARLSHPNVVAVYDQGADGRTLYLAMEYVPGQTLRDLLNERGYLSPRAALNIMDGVLAGLAAAHDAGLAHRDVKPENVLPSDSHSVKVADFGLARLRAGAGRRRHGGRAHRRLRVRDHAVRTAHGRAATHRRVAARGGLPARQRGGAGPLGRGSGPADRARHAGGPGHQQESRPAARRRRAVPASCDRGPARPAHRRAPRCAGGRPRRPAPRCWWHAAGRPGSAPGRPGSASCLLAHGGHAAGPPAR